MKTKLEIVEIVQRHFNIGMSDVEMYLSNKSIPIENYQEDILKKLNDLGNNLLEELISK